MKQKQKRKYQILETIANPRVLWVRGLWVQNLMVPMSSLPWRYWWLPFPTLQTSQKGVALWTTEGVNTGQAVETPYTAPLLTDAQVSIAVALAYKSQPLVVQYVLSLHPQTVGHFSPCCASSALYIMWFLLLTPLLWSEFAVPCLRQFPISRKEDEN